MQFWARPLQPNPQKYHHDLKWCVKTQRVVTKVFIKRIFYIFQKRKHHYLIFFCQFQATTSSKKKTPGTQRQYTCLSAEGKALVDKSPSFHCTHRNQLGCLGPSLSCMFLPVFTHTSCMAATLPSAFPSCPRWKLLFHSSTFGALVLNLCPSVSCQWNEVNRRTSVECKLWMATFEIVECSSSTMLSALQNHHNVQVSHSLECT